MSGPGAGAPHRTPLYDTHQALGGRLVDFAGWEMPQQYSTVQAEHLAVRSAAGLFDISHMGRVQVSGPGAGDFIQGLVSNDLRRIGPGRAQYNLLCREDGGILDDVVVYQETEQRFMVVVNASNRDQDLGWLRDHGRSGVQIEDRSDELALVAVQGPKAAALLAPMIAGVDLAKLPYFGFAAGRIGDAQAMIARTGYTGEDGFELFLPAGRVAELWTRILDAGRAEGVLPAGLAARDVCRLEAGLRLYGNDMDLETNPYEAGLGWVVRLEKGDFSGSEALAQVKAEGPRRQLVGLRCEGRTIPRHDGQVSKSGEPVGRVTSGTYSFWLKAGIGMASVRAGEAPLGTLLELDLRGQPAAAEVVALPFYRGSVQTPAAVKT